MKNLISLPSPNKTLSISIEIAPSTFIIITLSHCSFSPRDLSSPAATPSPAPPPSLATSPAALSTRDFSSNITTRNFSLQHLSTRDFSRIFLFIHGSQDIKYMTTLRDD